MADKRCKNGHFIDEAWDLCPYCPQESSEPEIPIVRPTRVANEPVRTPASTPPLRAGAPVSDPLTFVPRPGPGSVPDELDAPVTTRTIASQRVGLEGEAKRYVVGWLVGLNHSRRGESFTLRMGRNVLGRDRRSDVVIEDDQVSAHHADLVFRADERRFILMDRNSTNGTYVNETEIEPRRDLASGDVIRIGSHQFLFVPLCTDGAMWDNAGELK